MSHAVDKTKGRIKEAVGALAGDRKLKRQGKIDQVAGNVKEAAEKAVDRVKDSLKR